VSDQGAAVQEYVSSELRPAADDRSGAHDRALAHRARSRNTRRRMDDGRKLQPLGGRLLGEETPLGGPESTDRHMCGCEFVHVVDPVDREPLERLLATVARHVLDETLDVIAARLFGELGNLEREVACSEDEQGLTLGHGLGVCQTRSTQRPKLSRPMHTKRTTRLEFQPPAIGEEEVAAVAETVRSGWLGTGPRAALLEDRMREYLDVEHVLAVSSCTAAMQLALLALDVGPRDEVITTPLTWPATANVIELCGARPVFCDVRDSDLTIDPALAARLVGDSTKAILPVHLAGQPADLGQLQALGLPVIEDAAHALGGRYRGRRIGGISDVACFSLYVTKHIGAGEGGLLATNQPELAERVRAMRLTRRGPDGHYDQVARNLKSSLADVFAAIALVQLDKLEQHDDARRRQFTLYDDSLADLVGIEPLARDPRDEHAFHLYIVRIDPEEAGATRDEYQRALADELIATSIHFLPVHHLTWFSDRYPDQPQLPVAERAGRQVLSLPVSPAHSDDDIRDVVEAVRGLHARFTA
jgi:dTDP-4-amino-4,6-dideoxygalactose transaminase